MWNSGRFKRFDWNLAATVKTLREVNTSVVNSDRLVFDAASKMAADGTRNQCDLTEFLVYGRANTLQEQSANYSAAGDKSPLSRWDSWHRLAHLRCPWVKEPEPARPER